MSNFNDHPHVPVDLNLLSSPARRRYRPSSPFAEEEGLDDHFNFPTSQQTRPLTLLDIDVRNGVRSYPQPAMELLGATAAAPTAAPIPISEMTLEQKLQHFCNLAELQQKQMQEANEFAARQAEQLHASQQQLQESQQTVRNLSNAFQAISTQPRPTSSAPKKKPELPPFDSKNILIWIRRTEAAYARVGVIEARDKFAWLESMFQVKLNPKIDAFLYGTNTEDDWNNFIAYLKEEYGPTKRQKAQKLMSEVSRHDMKPSQFLTQLEEDTKDVQIDDIRKEHLLKTIPPRIREILGKEVESKSAKEIAAMADVYFDRQGRPLEKAANPINSIASNVSTAVDSTSPSSPSFTTAFSDEETDVNFVRKNNFRGNDRGRSRNRNNRSNSRPGFNRFPNSSSTSFRPSGDYGQQQQQHPAGTCRFHRKFGEKANKCQSDCPKFKAFAAQQQKQGNINGGRRM